MSRSALAKIAKASRLTAQAARLTAEAAKELEAEEKGEAPSASTEEGQARIRKRLRAMGVGT